MSVSKELIYSLDDVFVISATIDDSPSVEIPLNEIFDLSTYTLVDNFLQVIHGYVIELLEETTWMDELSFLRLRSAGYDIRCSMETGRSVPMERRELQRFVLQSLRQCQDNDHHFNVPIFLNFLVHHADLPLHQHRFKDSSRILRSFTSTTDKEHSPFLHVRRLSSRVTPQTLVLSTAFGCVWDGSQQRTTAQSNTDYVCPTQIMPITTVTETHLGIISFNDGT